MITAADQTSKRFSASGRETANVVAAVLPYIRNSGDFRILEIGCGEGSVAVQLALESPNIFIAGVDVSVINVSIAGEKAGALSMGNRSNFCAADYLAFRTMPFDLLYCCSVLHLIPADLNQLATKLADDLVPGGVLVLINPRECFSNTLIVLLRHCFRILRSRWLEAIALTVAMRVYPSWTREQLRDRLSYLYVIPFHLDGPKLRRTLQGAGFEVVRVGGWPRPSFFRLDHSCVVYRKIGRAV
jgi:ubiquinone/menaquinone biosynthesis C-methylase UbiE